MRGMPLALCPGRKALQLVPGFLAGLAHDVGQPHGLETLLDHGPRDQRIVGGQDDAAGLEFDMRADILGIDVRFGRRHHLAQDRFDVEHLGQTIAVVAVQAGDAGDHAAGAIAFGRQHLTPVEPYDVFDRFDGKSLRAAGVFGDQQDVEACLRGTARHRRQVDDRQNLTAQIDHAHHVGRRSGDGRDGRHGQDLANLEHIDAEQLAAAEAGVSAQTKQQQFQFVGTGQIGPFVDFLLDGLHGGGSP